MYDDTLQTQSFILERKQVSMVMFPKVIAMKFQGGERNPLLPSRGVKAKVHGTKCKDGPAFFISQKRSCGKQDQNRGHI